jgi:peptide/nickel transport system ATP-binding protein
LGISLLYITHDLATAYQVADTILVLYRASVAEAGDVELVVKSPQHPYTQLLIGSIPRVSTVRDWAAEVPQEERDIAASGCKFADRCPMAMARCLAEAPPLFQTARKRAVACFLHEDAPPLPDGKVETVMVAA